MHASRPLAVILGLLVLPFGGAAYAQDEPAASASASPVAIGQPDDPPQSVPMVPTFERARWDRLPTRRGPDAREDHTWTVDAAGGAAYLFGGRDGGKSFDDLWRFDLASDTWEKLKPSGGGPSARFGHSAVWVDGIGLVVFAGQRGADFFGDLWAYDPDGDRWTMLPGGGAAPRARYGSCAIVGPDGRLWISHGFTFAGRFDDTRAYNFRTDRWTSIAPDGRRPGERCLHDCFTSASGQLVLYGGQDDDERALGDLWVTRPDGRWQKRRRPRLAARRLYAVTEAGADAFIFGGAGKDDAVLGDFWRVDRKTLESSRVRVRGATPPGRSAGTLISDPVRGRLLLFGGKAGVARDDLWQLSDLSVADDGSAEATIPASPPASIEPAQASPEP